MFIGLYAIRVVLKELGADDYGLFAIVSSFVMLGSFVTSSLASATQRFFSYALGEGSLKKLKQAFSVNLVIYLLIGLLSVFILETLGFFYINNMSNIPSGRTDSVINLYHYSCITFFFTIINAPLISIMISHEHMRAYAYIGIFEALLKLMAVLLLPFSMGMDKLEFYGLSLLFVSGVVTVVYVFYCFVRFPECQIKVLYWNSQVFKETLQFTGWTLFGQLSTVMRTQGVTVLIGHYVNPITAASRAIAISVSNQINVFSTRFNTGLYPSIIKSYAEKNLKEMHRLIFMGTILSFSLMWLFSLPLFLEMERVLFLWLGDVPEYSVDFSRLALIESLILSVAMPLATAARAPGKMKVYELTLGFCQMLILFSSYVFLKGGYNPILVYISAIVISVIMFLLRLLIVSKLISLNTFHYFKFSILPILFIGGGASLITIAVFIELKGIESMIRIFSISLINFIVTCFLTYKFGLNDELKEVIKRFIYKKFKRVA